MQPPESLNHKKKKRRKNKRGNKKFKLAKFAEASVIWQFIYLKTKKMSNESILRSTGKKKTEKKSKNV